ncbi:MAG TPA: DUF6198 family protein, partial [Ruminococcus sp.]|nr:DUF6198 family protein [Ruminococcus sp.]
GWWLNLWSVVQICVQVALLKQKSKPAEILIQTLLAFAYGYLTDFSCWLIRGLSAETYPVKLALMLLSCFVLGFGIWVQFKGGVAMLPGEAMNRAISQVTGRRYENVKIFFDVAYIIAAALICFIFLGKPEGVREGSLIAAVLIGSIIKLYNSLFSRLTQHRQHLKEERS